MSTFEVSRSASIAADPALVHRLINDFHEWPKWSPWEDLDPAMERTHSGAEAGVGAHYSWDGNRKAGEGSMEITSSSPDQVGLTVTFLKPMRATNEIVFALEPTTHGTEVTWTMHGEQKGLMAILGKVIPMDRLVGKDFEKGLARLKDAAEA
jgi:polyketide cyclase/dehydrase/lipid transport protein